MNWVCPVCSTNNKDDARQCVVCDAERPPNSWGLDLQSQIDRLKATLLFQEETSERVDLASMYQRAVALLRTSPEEGLEKIMFCANKGYALAQNMMGELYFGGVVVEQDYAQNELGDCYYFGTGTPKELRKAFEWYEKSAAQNNAKGQFNLGYCYYSGKGTAQNFEKAFVLFQKSSKQGYMRATYALGECYFYGQGTAQNYSAARECFYRAAQADVADAQRRLGECYEHGYGTIASREEAITWYRKAAEQGDDNAIKALRRLSS